MVFSCTLRRYRDGDEQSIIELLDAALGQRYSLEYWKWKYTRNPAGPPFIWLAEYDDRIIGHYAFIPIAMKVGNAYVSGSLACDAAIHPDYQGQGVFSSIVNRSCLDAGENGIPITYGFANTNLGATYRRYERMGQICLLIRMVRVLDWESVLARYIHNECLASATEAVLRKFRRSKYPESTITIEHVDRFDERIDAFWERISSSFNVIARRNQRYLNWRYVDHPEKDYTIYAAMKDRTILGYCALAREEWHNLRVGVIVDIIGFQDYRNVVPSLIDRAVNWFEEQDAEAIGSMMSDQHPYARLFAKAGFIRYPSRNTALYATVNLPGSPIDQKEVYSQALLLSQNRLLKKKSNWFIMQGDSDFPL